MGFDVSYHPISAQEMHEWYFDRLPEIRKNKKSKAKNIARESGMEAFYVKRYIELLRQAVAQFSGSGLFESTHGFALAAIQGLFRQYYYTRGSSLTDLAEEDDTFLQYTTPITEALGFTPEEKVYGSLPSNYASGLWLSPKNVSDFLEGLESSPSLKESFLLCFPDGQSAVVLKALRAAFAEELGLLEASEIIEPNPFDLNSSSSISNLFNCDSEGALLYQQVALGQIRDAGLDL
jgi:hypothetical protein